MNSRGPSRCLSCVVLTLLAASSLALESVSAQAGADLSPLEPAAQNSPPPPRNALDKKDLEFYVRHLNVWGPRIDVEISDFKPAPIEGLLETTVRASYQQASQDRTFYVSKDGRHIFEGRTFDITKNPFQSSLEKITTADQPGFGKPGAPVAIVAYSDFQCPYCAKEAQVLRKQVRETYPEQVRVYFRDFPLRNHNWAFDAAIAGRCIYRIEPETFWDYHDWIFENQSQVTPQNLKDKVMEFAAGKGIDPLKLSPCMDRRETESLVQESLEEGRALGVTSTPTIFVNGRQLTGSVRWEQLKQIIDYEIEYQKVAQNAGDDCGCTVPLSFPGAQ